MTVLKNKRVILVKRPTGKPQPEHFSVDEKEIDTESLKPGEIIVRTEYGSLDPYLYMGMGTPQTTGKQTPHGLSQFKDAVPVDLGDAFGGRGAGVVIESKHDKVKKGDLVAADWRWQQYAKFNVDEEVTFEILENDIFGPNGVKLSYALGVLSVSGAHALWGYRYLQLKQGQTLVISAAGGNIGIIVGQYAKAHGIKVVGIAGGADKCAKLKTELGYDEVVDYREYNTVQELADAIKKVAPEGVDAYYDNVGGTVTEAVAHVLKNGGRAYMCGNVSQYTNGKNVEWDEKVAQIYKEKNVENITCTKADYINRVAEARTHLYEYIKDGRIKPIEWVVNGVENAAQAFVDLYQGKNFGKAIVKIGE